MKQEQQKNEAVVPILKFEKQLKRAVVHCKNSAGDSFELELQNVTATEIKQIINSLQL